MWHAKKICYLKVFNYWVYKKKLEYLKTSQSFQQKHTVQRTKYKHSNSWNNGLESVYAHWKLKIRNQIKLISTPSIFSVEI